MWCSFQEMRRFSVEMRRFFPRQTFLRSGERFVRCANGSFPSNSGLFQSAAQQTRQEPVSLFWFHGALPRRMTMPQKPVRPETMSVTAMNCCAAFVSPVAGGRKAVERLCRAAAWGADRLARQKKRSRASFFVGAERLCAVSEKECKYFLAKENPDLQFRQSHFPPSKKMRPAARPVLRAAFPFQGKRLGSGARHAYFPKACWTTSSAPFFTSRRSSGGSMSWARC